MVLSLLRYWYFILTNIQLPILTLVIVGYYWLCFLYFFYAKLPY